MDLIDAIILGIIQGVTEFLPISSSGHLELGKALLGIQIRENLLFSVILHLATALSTIVVYRKDIIVILIDLFKFVWNESTQFAAKLALSMFPVLLVGIFLKDEIASFFSGKIVLVGISLLITGILLLLTVRLKKVNTNKTTTTFSDAFIIGIAQAIAVLPGISRAGATISTALLLGVNNEKAAKFSFLMVLIPIMGASLLEIKDYLSLIDHSQSIGMLPLVFGFTSAFISGLAACVWMVKLVKKGRLEFFAAYCLFVGLLAITLA